jgi:hypothetical protein
LSSARYFSERWRVATWRTWVAKINIIIIINGSAVIIVAIQWNVNGMCRELIGGGGGVDSRCERVVVWFEFVVVVNNNRHVVT